MATVKIGIGGPVGSGKTALVDDLRTHIAARGAVALTGLAEPKSTTPYRAIREALMPVLGNLSGIADEDASAVRDLLMEVREPATPEPFVDEEDLRRQALSGVARSLELLARRRPIILVLENAQLPGVAPKGRIALQHHGDPIEFANIYIRELGQ